MRISSICVALLLCVVNPAYSDERVDVEPRTISECPVYNYSKGVYVFVCPDEFKFADALSTVLKENPGSEVSAMFGEGDANGHQHGFLVTITRKNPK